MREESVGAVKRQSVRRLLGVGHASLGMLIRFCKSSPLGAVALFLLVVIALVAIFAPLVAPYDPLAAPGGLRKPPSADHLMGTDILGRDVLSRVIFGARISLMVAFASIAIGDGLGFIWGVVTGYFGRRTDLVTQRFVDALMAFPTVVLALLLMAALGAGLHTVIIAISVVRVPASTRVIRSVAMSIKEMPYVEAARSIGASHLRIMIQHIAPQCMAPAMVVASVGLGIAIFTEAALSFLGMGIPPPHSTWGNMLGGILANIFKPPWWLVVFPGVAITITVMAFNLLGDALRDYLDPRLRGRL
ncbi:MAG: ABC transporter permease [Chloroflexota bacterium]|nr:ABC transporter permease [Chloroflexota bacterium]